MRRTMNKLKNMMTAHNGLSIFSAKIDTWYKIRIAQLSYDSNLKEVDIETDKRKDSIY